MRAIGMRVAACQTPEILGDVEAALRTIEAAAESARDADLLLLPEGFLQGYLAEASHVAQHAIDLGSPEFHTIQSRLSHLPQVLVFGVLERKDGVHFNAAVVLDRGELLGVYRKTHLYGSELTVFDPGHDYPVFDVAGVRFGLNICYDTRFPEAAARIANQGARLLLVLSQNMMRSSSAIEWKDRHNAIRRERVLETGMWLVSADVTGSRDGDPDDPGERRIGLGPTSVMDPSGTVVAQVPLGAPGIVTVQIPVASTFA